MVERSNAAETLSRSGDAVGSSSAAPRGDSRASHEDRGRSLRPPESMEILREAGFAAGASCPPSGAATSATLSGLLRWCADRHQGLPVDGVGGRGAQRPPGCDRPVGTLRPGRGLGDRARHGHLLFRVPDDEGEAGRGWDGRRAGVAGRAAASTPNGRWSGPAFRTSATRSFPSATITRTCSWCTGASTRSRTPGTQRACEGRDRTTSSSRTCSFPIAAWKR